MHSFLEEKIVAYPSINNLNKQASDTQHGARRPDIRRFAQSTNPLAPLQLALFTHAAKHSFELTGTVSD